MTRPIALHVQAAALRYGVPESLVAAVISVESEFNPRAVSRRGAIGLMQLMPGTAALLGVRNAFDPAENVDAGARHLRDLLDRFDNDVSLALAAYNAGAQTVMRYGGVPPYPETRAFVARVLGRVGRVTMPAVVVVHASTAPPPPPRIRLARMTADRLRREDGLVAVVLDDATPVTVAVTLPPSGFGPAAEPVPEPRPGFGAADPPPVTAPAVVRVESP